MSNEIIRLSGNVKVDGTMEYNTSSVSSGWSSEKISKGKIRITFGGKTFSEPPNVTANVLYTDAEGPQGSFNIGILPSSEFIEIELWQGNVGLVDKQISFVAFGRFQ